MKNLMLAMCCLVLLEGCKSSKKMEKQPAPKKTMATAHKKAIKKPAQKSGVKKAGVQKSEMKKQQTKKPAGKAGEQKHGMKKHAMDKPAQKGGAKKPAQTSGMHKVKKSEKDKALVQGLGSNVGKGVI